MELATKGHVQEILSTLQPANAAQKMATVSVLESGAIAATQPDNAVLAMTFVHSACANLETAQYQL